MLHILLYGKFDERYFDISSFNGDSFIVERSILLVLVATTGGRRSCSEKSQLFAVLLYRL